jgi:deoxyribonuclease V
MSAVRISKIHPWEVDVKEAKSIQRRIVDSLVLEWLDTEVEFVAGCDVSSAKGEDDIYAAVVVMELPTMRVIERSYAQAKAIFPYIPGLLSFREGPVLLSAFEELETKPQVVLLDGQGIAHPRGVGLASHIGLFLDLPTIGCAKSRLVGEYGPVGENVGDLSPLLFEGREVGAVLRTKPNVKPIFVSPGHRMTTDAAVKLVMKMVRGYRLPEPTRQADILVGEFRKAKMRPEEAQQQSLL